MKSTFRFLAATAAVSLLSSLRLAAFGGPIADEQSYTPEQERAKAAEFLATRPDAIAVRVKGLICETCGYGVYRNLRRVDGVDDDRFNDGAEIDIYSQFLFVAQADDEAIDLREVIEAVDDAGYTPVSAYLLADGRLEGEQYVVSGVNTPLTVAEGQDLAAPQLISVRVDDVKATSYAVALNAIR